MSHTYTNLLTHFVFSTKDRVPTLEPELKERLLPYMGGIVRELKGVALSINGPTDHVHLFASLPAILAPAEFVGKVKAISTGWVHKEFLNHWAFSWQIGYSAFSVSHSQKQVVLDYIANQEEHHRRMSFKEELIAFLNKHEIEYDERYLWD
jgi:putative transposase